MSANVGDLHAAAVAFLAASVDALDFTPAGSPSRAYVNAGMPALECEQLVVWIEDIQESRFRVGTGAEARAKAINRGGLARYLVQVQCVRCVPVMQIKGANTLVFPSPTEAQAAALVIDEDGWALWVGLNYALKHGTLHKRCLGAERLGAQKLVPQGGFGGWTFTFRVPIEAGVLGT